LQLLNDRHDSLLQNHVLLQTRLSTHPVKATRSGINEDLDVYYGGADGADEHILDLQWPSEALPVGGWPAVIALHGNGADKGSMYYVCRKRAKAGRLCMAPNRRSKSYAESDSKLAIEWLFANAATYNVNVNKVVLYGYSKGGFITNTLIWEDPEVEEKVAAAIIASGVAGKHANMAHAEGPPMLLISCENDNVVKYKHTEKMYDKLVDFGSDVTLWTCHSGHGSQKAEGFNEEIEAFLDRVAPISGDFSTPEQGGAAPPAATPTTTSTMAPITSNCMDWCEKHSGAYSCEWDSCSGCNACLMT
jgi:predicted esterase